MEAKTKIAEGTPRTIEEQVAALKHNHKLELDDSRRDVILVIGRSGVGKSIMTEILFGDLSALESTFDEYYCCTKIRNMRIDPEEEAPSMFQSDTICPQIFTDHEKPGLAIYDCPGFADTRGTSNEIATGVYLSEIVEHASRVKLVVTVDYDSVKPNADRTKFTDGVLTEVLDFVVNNDIYDGGVFLLVNKYANPYEGLHDPNNKFRDEKVVSFIANFLKEAQEHAIQCSKDENRRAAISALFENSWLKKVEGKYPNIGFSRVITGEGKLSDMESLLTRRTKIRTQFLDNPSFVFKPADRHHFGCPISEASKLEVRKIQKNLGDGAEVILAAVVQKVINKIAESSEDHNQIWTCVHEYHSFSTDMKELAEAEENSGLTTNSLELLHKLGSNIKADIQSEISELNEAVKRMKYLSGVDIEESFATRKKADLKFKEIMVRMTKDLMIEFRKAQKIMVTQANESLKSVVRRVVSKFSKSTYIDSIVLFNQFSNNLEALPSDCAGLTDESLKILSDFGYSIGDPMKDEVEKLAGIICSLKYLTGIDPEQSAATWSEVHEKWTTSMEFVNKDIARLEAQKKFAQAVARSEETAAKAAAAISAVRASADLAAAEAEAELVRARFERDRLRDEADAAAARARDRADIAFLSASLKADGIKNRWYKKF